MSVFCKFVSGRSTMATRTSGLTTAAKLGVPRQTVTLVIMFLSRPRHDTVRFHEWSILGSAPSYRSPPPHPVIVTVGWSVVVIAVLHVTTTELFATPPTGPAHALFFVVLLVLHVRLFWVRTLPLLLLLFLHQTVVPSAISDGSTTDYQTFNVGVHANLIRLVPKFHKYDQWIGIKEV